MAYGSLKKRQGVLKKEEKDSIKSGIANPLQHQSLQHQSPPTGE